MDAALEPPMNYFAYFSEIEEHFSRRRGSILLLNTLDWALIETWREAGIPLEAVLRGIDAAFDKYEARSHKAGGKIRKVNGLAWCAQAVLQAAEELVEASTGLAPVKAQQDAGFEGARVAAFLERNAAAVEGAGFSETAARLRELAASMRGPSPMALDELDRVLTVLEEKLLLALQAAASEAELVALKAEAERALAPYRAKIGAVQLRQIHAQFLHKRLLEARGLPRLSLFYMGHED
jgi:ABC-type transporter Mla subunit MlaD